MALEGLERKTNELLLEVREWLVDHRRVGNVPPLFRAMGFSDYEKPYNRLLAWLLSPSSEHSAAQALLSGLAKLISSPELKMDVAEALSEIEVRGERSFPDEAGCPGRIPDILILAPSVIVLLENKVHAPESGEGQYPDYLAGTVNLAACRGVPHRVFLTARNDREVPGGWDGFIRHSEFAQLLRVAAMSGELSQWDSVLSLIAAGQLEDSLPASHFADKLEYVVSDLCSGFKVSAAIKLASIWRNTPSITGLILDGGTNAEVG